MTRTQGEIEVERILSYEGQDFQVSGTVEYEWELDDGNYTDSPPDDPELTWNVLGVTAFPVDGEGRMGPQVTSQGLLLRLGNLLEKQLTYDSFPNPW